MSLPPVPTAARPSLLARLATCVAILAAAALAACSTPTAPKEALRQPNSSTLRSDAPTGTPGAADTTRNDTTVTPHDRGFWW